MKILVAGDSFAAEWPGDDGWVKLLAQSHEVTNVAQAGCGEYKIFKQIQKANLDEYDCVIVSHTSPSRVHTLNHPLHKQGLHKDCDLLWNDIDRTTFFNSSLSAAKGYFRYHYDDQYQCDMYALVRQQINTLLTNKQYISISHVEVARLFVVEDTHIDFSEFWDEHRGIQNHYSTTGNQKLHQIIIDNVK
jgi:hypothetical protein|tara:strand:- start:49 stop:618 length:570 start_codon:yes stop_codon:yes gene_type:complete